MSETKVITGKVRFSYANVWEPRALNQNDEPKYGVVLLIPKTDTATVSAINAAVNAAFEMGVTKKFEGKRPPVWKNPLRDGDVEKPDDEDYKGCYFVTANSQTRPGIVDANVQDIISQDEFYSGCYGRASINMFAYNSNGNKGVAVGLNNLQKLEEGVRLAGGSTAAEDFGTPQAGGIGDLM